MVTSDIYSVVDNELVKKGFWFCDVDEKKRLVGDELKNYLLHKINGCSLDESLLCDGKSDLSVNELLGILIKINQDTHPFEIVSHFIHYIIAVAGSIQKCVILWWTDDELIGDPVITFDNDGVWDRLTTNNSHDPLSIFNFVYDVFINNFLVNEKAKDVKCLIK